MKGQTELMGPESMLYSERVDMYRRDSKSCLLFAVMVNFESSDSSWEGIARVNIAFVNKRCVGEVRE